MMPDLWELATIALKWALYLGILGATGTVLCRAVFRLENTRFLTIGFASLGLVSAVMSFMIKGVSLTGDVSGMTDPEMLSLLWSTQSGTVLMLQTGGLGMIVLGLCTAQLGKLLSLMGALLALFSFLSAGHIGDRSNWILTAALLLHLSGAAFWIGILTPLRRLILNKSKQYEAAELGERFGRVAMMAVPGMIVAGVAMAYALVGSFAGLLGTAYGQTLLLKVGLVAGLLGLAAVNKLRLVPGIRRGNQSDARHLSQSILVEWGVILLILLVTAILTTSLTLPT